MLMNINNGGDAGVSIGLMAFNLLVCVLCALNTWWAWRLARMQGVLTNGLLTGANLTLGLGNGFAAFYPGEDHLWLIIAGTVMLIGALLIMVLGGLYNRSTR